MRIEISPNRKETTIYFYGRIGGVINAITDIDFINAVKSVNTNILNIRKFFEIFFKKNSPSPPHSLIFAIKARGPASQQVNESTSQQVNRSTSQRVLGSVWVCHGSEGSAWG